MSKQTKSKVIVLRLSPEKLAQWPSDSVIQPTTKRSTSTSTPSVSSAPAQPSIVEPSPSATGTDANNATPKLETPTPAPNGCLAPPPNHPNRRKGIPGPKPGSKRAAPSLGPDGAPKPRGKPGPKKKPRPGDPVDANGNLIGQAPAAPKLGPKANMGAINAGLRALDRTGKPCKRWVQRGFQVKSFTGVSWDVPCWGNRRNGDDNGDVKSESSGKPESSGEEMNGVLASSPADAIAAE